MKISVAVLTLVLSAAGSLARPLKDSDAPVRGDKLARRQDDGTPTASETYSEPTIASATDTAAASDTDNPTLSDDDRTQTQDSNGNSGAVTTDENDQEDEAGDDDEETDTNYGNGDADQDIIQSDDDEDDVADDDEDGSNATDDNQSADSTTSSDSSTADDSTSDGDHTDDTSTSSDVFANIAASTWQKIQISTGTAGNAASAADKLLSAAPSDLSTLSTDDIATLKNIYRVCHDANEAFDKAIESASGDNKTALEAGKTANQVLGSRAKLLALEAELAHAHGHGDDSHSHIQSELNEEKQKYKKDCDTDLGHAGRTMHSVDFDEAVDKK